MEPHLERIRQFAKHVVNPITIKISGRTFSPFATLSHVGRKSRKPYETPLVVRPTKQGFVIALTYGPEVDWYRNVVAAGHASLRWHGRDYEIASPVPVAMKKALRLFPLPARVILTKINVHDFVLVPRQKAEQ